MKINIDIEIEVNGNLCSSVCDFLDFNESFRIDYCQLFKTELHGDGGISNVTRCEQCMKFGG